MANDMLSKVRKLNWLLQEAPKGNFSFHDLCVMLSDLMDANVYLSNAKGKILGVSYKVEADKNTIKDQITGTDFFREDYNVELMKIQETRTNLQDEDILKIFKDDQATKAKYHTIVPITGGGVRWGTLMLTRYKPEFSSEDLVLCEVGATVVGLEIQRVKSLELDAEIRNAEIVKMALSTLSYSENEAVIRIFEELEEKEGIIIASKIADRSRITRSVIVNALRKLESAGVIESKSLGMKGTHIKVLNDKFHEQLEAIKNK